MSVGGDEWAGEGFVLFVPGTADVSNEAEILKSLRTTRGGKQKSGFYAFTLQG